MLSFFFFFCRLVARDTGLPSAAPLLRSYAKVEKMTIAELSNFVITAASQVTIVWHPLRLVLFYIQCFVCTF